MKTKTSKCGDRLEWAADDIGDAEMMDAGLKMTRVATAHDRAMEIAEKCMDEYREVFEALAKS